MLPRQLIKLSNFDKSLMKCEELFNTHFCKNKILFIPNETVEISNLHFSHYKSMKTISCHSNQSSYPIGIKNISFVEGNVLCKYAKFQLHPPRRILNIYSKRALPFMSPRQPIKSSYLDKSRMKHGGLLNKHFCKIKNQISPMTWQKCQFPLFTL